MSGCEQGVSQPQHTKVSRACAKNTGCLLLAPLESCSSNAMVFLLHFPLEHTSSPYIFCMHCVSGCRWGLPCLRHYPKVREDRCALLMTVKPPPHRLVAIWLFSMLFERMNKHHDWDTSSKKSSPAPQRGQVSLPHTGTVHLASEHLIQRHLTSPWAPGVHDLL